MHSVFGMYNRDKGEELSFIIRGMSFDDDYLRDCYLSMATNDGTCMAFGCREDDTDLGHDGMRHGGTSCDIDAGEI